LFVRRRDSLDEYSGECGNDRDIPAVSRLASEQGMNVVLEE
jgi:hypothetical protein